MRVVGFVFLLLVIVCAACNAGDCSCALTGVIVSSSTHDLVGLSGCGHSQTCSPDMPCDTLLIPPPSDGGACAVTISFVDGGTQQFAADFGKMHPSNDCCGNFYDTSEVTFHVQ